MKESNKQIIETQKRIVHAIRENERKQSLRSIDDGWLRISKDLRRKKRQKHIRYSAYVAAAAVVCLLIITGYYQSWKSDSVDYDTLVENLSQTESKDVLLYIEGEKITTPTEKPQITYTPTGDITIDNKKVNSLPSQSKRLHSEFNSIFVPKGKQSFLTLSDGTKIHINSRTKIIYPTTFSPDKREIYIEGEAFLEVAHDKNAPFIVKTSSFDICVLGTKFNVFSYKEKRYASITLLEGAVNITDHNNSSAQLKPLEKIRFVDGIMGEPERIKYFTDTDWIHGYYSFTNTPLSEIIEKLAFYFDINYDLDEDIKDYPLSGKLDIRLELDDILNNLSQTTHFLFYCENEKLICRKK